MKLRTILGTILALGLSITNANATILLSDNFESGTLDIGAFGSSSTWYYNKTSYITTDPVEGDKALTFSGLSGGGDLYSNYISSSTGIFDISFDYLGSCTTGNCGGFFWNNVTGWDGTTSPYRDTLIDNGEWNTYSFQVAASTLEIRLEDWSGSGGVAGDAFFDNILITDGQVPEPSVIALMLAGFGGLAFVRRRKQ